MSSGLEAKVEHECQKGSDSLAGLTNSLLFLPRPNPIGEVLNMPPGGRRALQPHRNESVSMLCKQKISFWGSTKGNI